MPDHKPAVTRPQTRWRPRTQQARPGPTVEPDDLRKPRDRRSAAQHPVTNEHQTSVRPSGGNPHGTGVGGVPRQAAAPPVSKVDTSHMAVCG
jgi:hypothetical protein